MNIKKNQNNSQKLLEDKLNKREKELSKIIEFLDNK